MFFRNLSIRNGPFRGAFATSLLLFRIQWHSSIIMSFPPDFLFSVVAYSQAISRHRLFCRNFPFSIRPLSSYLLTFFRSIPFWVSSCPPSALSRKAAAQCKYSWGGEEGCTTRLMGKKIPSERSLGRGAPSYFKKF